MGMKEEFAKVAAVAATLASAPVVASATEGTNEVGGWVFLDRISS